jgi:NAD(P)-dependent dehydrogenase (short-subunit alcohol dehydrogenase family)
MSLLSTFSQPVHAVVIGASGGIGAAVVELLLADENVAHVHGFSRKAHSRQHEKYTTGQLDLTDDASIAAAATGMTTPVQLVFVATGILHSENFIRPEKTWRTLDAAAMVQSYAINAIGPALVAKYFLPLLPRGERAIFAALSARVGSISDNNLGGWYAYRAAKAALNQLIRTLSLELAQKHKNAICAGLHPGTVDTDLSKPFQSGVSAAKLFTPEVSARHLLNVLNRLTPADSGGLYAWDGARIPF